MTSCKNIDTYILIKSARNIFLFTKIADLQHHVFTSAKSSKNPILQFNIQICDSNFNKVFYGGVQALTTLG